MHLPGLTLCQVAIHTGRTHQIRVHLSAIGHPVVGDSVYGGVHRRVAGDIRAVQRLERPFLHAARLAFTHPRDGRRMEFTAPLPDDLQDVLDALPHEAGRWRPKTVDTPIVPSKVRTVFEGRVFTVRVESITLPKGHALDAEIVQHPGSVVIVPMNDANEIVLVRQYRHAIGRYTWELPAGSLKPGEDAKAAARRECQEEIGTSCRSPRAARRVLPDARLLQRRDALLPGHGAARAARRR